VAARRIRLLTLERDVLWGAVLVLILVLLWVSR
jgi:hypothetical protein